MILMGHCSLDLKKGKCFPSSDFYHCNKERRDDLIRSPEIVEAVLFVLCVDDLQLGLDAALPKDGTHEEGDEATERLREVRRGDVEVKVGVLGGRVGVGAPPAGSCAREAFIASSLAGSALPTLPFHPRWCLTLSYTQSVL